MNPEVINGIIYGICFLAICLYIYYEWKQYKKKKKKLKNMKYPPYTSECPDYWKVIGKNKCQRIHDVGIPNCSPTGHSKMKNNIVDFNVYKYKGNVGIKNKCRWSKDCMVPWEGIDNRCI